MNKIQNRPLIKMQLCAMMLLALLIPASARAQTPPTARADYQGDATCAPVGSAFTSPVAPWGSLVMPANSMRNKIDNLVTSEFIKAWRDAADGTSSHESVLLIFRMKDGSYTARSLGFTNEYQQFTFKWNLAAVAIVHTHPNRSDPRPAEQDRRVADKYGVPNFTITISGMYVYDPVTRQTSKVLNGLDWLNLSSYADTVTRWLRM